MFLRKLKLVNFRNYSQFEQTFNQLKTIIIGQNAQGKSNILEAINILATSNSERAEKDSDLILWGNEYALVFADIESKKEPQLTIALQINMGGRRQLKINGVTKRSPQADLLGNFFAVMFSCEDLYLIKGSPSVRRRWIDLILYQLDHKFHKSSLEYQKAVTQKNTLLKHAREEGLSLSKIKPQIEVWNEQIINHGTEIINARLGFFEEIKPVAKKFLSDISKHNEEFNLSYKSSMSDLEINQLNTRNIFQKSLEESMQNELIRGQALVGPHRDDVNFLINKKEVKSFASQGQQRSIVLALKLAELKIIEKRKNEIPVLLLDDVFAELDESRQDFLLHNLPTNIQILLTTTHISDIQKEFLKNADILEICNGKISQHAKATK